MQVFAKGVAAAIKQVCPCIKVGQAVLGLEVPHAHIHLIPINKESDMLFSKPKLQLTKEEFEEIKKHPVHGNQILSRISKSPYLRM